MTDVKLVKIDLGGGDVELSDPSRLPADPLVSVWMITYNQAHYIREALDSVLMQQVDFPYEICLGEDGSTDGTREICEEYACKHPDKIRLFLRDRNNPARARYKLPYRHNTVETWNACRGKHIAMLEGDDYWVTSQKLQRQVDVMLENHDVSLCSHASLVYRWPPSYPPRGYIKMQPRQRFTLKDVLACRSVSHTSSYMVRRAAPIPEVLLRNSPNGDGPIVFWHLLHGIGIELPEIMSVYRQNTGGVWTSVGELEQRQRGLEFWQLIRPFVPEEEMGTYLESYYVHCLARVAVAKRASKQVIGAIRDAAAAIHGVWTTRECRWRARRTVVLLLLEGLLSPGMLRLHERLWHRLRP